ncbi:MAG: EAL domain-containing protein [Methyloversatilis sp.]|uniref:putative bifunctional diguanylate cyclase/phosphodiesterase n=1 Tax=Methyloversatilis sp. TaxID=2569862 RepID=UPI002734A9A7|nr:EAL domain-containing protein [Methyloversatilis sp.]MDP3871881.1 EAL domain-containing protein [Methyloversatilis sp.]
MNSLKWRIAACCALLLLVVQAGGLLMFGQLGRASALNDVRAELQTADRVLSRLLEQRASQLTQAARVLAADYGFREALTSRDNETIVSALGNHGGRIEASLMMLLGLDESVTAVYPDEAQGVAPQLHGLIENARNGGSGSGLVIIDGTLYQVVVVPVLAPLPVAYVVTAFIVDQPFVQDLKRVSGLDLSFLSRVEGDEWVLAASSLADTLQPGLLAAFRGHGGALPEMLSLDGKDYASRPKIIEAGTLQHITVVLQLSLDRALEPWQRLYDNWLQLSLAGMLFALVASALLGRSIASPVARLAQFARRVGKGEYGVPPVMDRRDEIGQLADAFSHMTDAISTREARISELAYRDTLTGLPNRAYFVERLTDGVRDAKTRDGALAVLTLDMDRFKMVNDALGHGLGDLLLVEVGKRLRDTLRDVRDQVARLGGDEFAVLLPGADAHKAWGVAMRIAEALDQPMSLEGQMVDVSASMGISSFPEHGDDVQALLRHADVAMYQAKRHNSGAAIYDPRHHERNVERLSLLTELRAAVEHDELVLYYQPKVALVPGRQHHVEALVRWIHPTRGFIPPFDFIPFAEQTGYVKAITLWVMNAAIRQCGLWLRAGLEVNVSLNISARDLLNPDLPTSFIEMLQRHGCESRLITLEITESAVLDDPLRALANLQALRDTGCLLSIDDYGTGYSSLSYLKQMPVSEMKIDRSFVMNLVENPNDEIIVRSTIELAHNMGLKVTAEGVETEAVLERLRELGCDLVQGYLISKPIPVAALENWFRESHWALISVARPDTCADNDEVVAKPEHADAL